MKYLISDVSMLELIKMKTVDVIWNIFWNVGEIMFLYGLEISSV